MKLKLLIVCCVFVLGCSLGGTHQEINIVNNSSDDIFYILKPDSVLKEKDVWSVRPMTDKEIQTHFIRGQIHFESTGDSLSAINDMKSIYLIKKGNIKKILGSRFVSIFPDKESIKSQIEREYNGKAYVFIIPEKALNTNTDNEIIKNKYVKYYKTLSAENLISDTLNLVYE